MATRSLGMLKARTSLGSLARKAHRKQEQFLQESNDMPLGVIVEVYKHEDREAFGNLLRSRIRAGRYRLRYDIDDQRAALRSSDSRAQVK